MLRELLPDLRQPGKVDVTASGAAEVGTSGESVREQCGNRIVAWCMPDKTLWIGKLWYKMHNTR